MTYGYTSSEIDLDTADMAYRLFWQGWMASCYKDKVVKRNTILEVSRGVYLAIQVMEHLEELADLKRSGDE